MPRPAKTAHPIVQAPSDAPWWQFQVKQAEALDERREVQRRKPVYARALQDLERGATVWYRPKTADTPHAGERGTITRPPRLDANGLMLTVQFADGHEQRVSLRQLRVEVVQPPFTMVPPLGGTATYTPAKATARHAGETCTVLRQPIHTRSFRTVRIQFRNGDEVVAPIEQINLIDVPFSPDEFVEAAKKTKSFAFLTAQVNDPEQRAAAEQRARQLAGQVTPRTVASQRPEVATRILAAAGEAARELAARVPQRGGRGPVQHRHLPVPTDAAADLQLDQEQRARLNDIAKCIHRRYFLSDAELRDLTEGEREKERATSILGSFLHQAQRDAGLVAVQGHTGKGSELHGRLTDTLAEAYPLALEACEHLLSGKTDLALTLALRVRALRLEYTAVNTVLDRDRRKHYTGRYFHGDVLSVREEHEGGGMTQYYARVTFVYGEDGHSLIVANAAELESLTGMRVGVQAWTSLCRWVQDLSERAGGRKQGRRQDDDEHLIYRDDRDCLVLRDSLSQYPNILRALECIRRALMVDYRDAGILTSEIPDNHPAPGYHPPQPRQEGTDTSGGT
ncbi:hypothetical protein [Deinococcus soli (ex Cha et al. 2016)]|uniref:hypothetical protein n=1 Tax=Deinococcus soli (ex Cha et al. 2016) TaxID=1309411 RepID=UPI0016677E3E|nr:hypothetical protein [Deinococcus soli (ex Cha et al. 2016)]GGB64618.1 hypothetical protein GCM10008019_20910 [Deinococcus soli (ex Cha et al. 2016)]